MRTVLRLCLFLGIAAVLSAAEPILKVISPWKTLAFTAEELAALPPTELKVLDPHTNQEHNYTGVAVRELLLRAGAPLGDSLRGPALQLVVVFRSHDGYGVTFTLADFDEAFSHRTLLLADRQDGQPLPSNAAPLRLIAPGDKRAARWARMVASIEVLSVGNTVASAKP